jgi:ribosomal protein S18 acetylase RimI-like enzyme
MKQKIPIKEVQSEALSVDVAKLEDAEALAEILTSGLRNKIAHGDMAWGTEPYASEELRERIKEGNTYIAKLGNQPVGTLLLIWEDEMMWGEQPPVAAYVHQLAIKDGYRGMDLGRQLLDWAGQQAASNDRKLLRIDFPPENQGLKSYYEKLGFQWVQNREVNAPNATYTAALYERPTT